MGFAEALQVIIGVISAAQKAEDDSNFSHWKDSVSSKLDEILDNTNLILDELKELRLAVERVDEMFRRIYVGRLRALIMSIGNLMSLNHLSADDKRSLRGFLDVLRPHLYECPTYGFAATYVALCGYVVLIHGMRRAGYQATDIQAVKVDMWRSVFAGAVDPGISGSYSWAASKADTRAAELAASLRAGLRPTTIGFIWESLPGTGPNFGGDLTFPTFNVSVITTDFTGNPRKPETINATPLAIALVETEVFSPKISFENVQPRPISGARRVYGAGDARQLQSDWIAQYRSYSKEMLMEEDNAAKMKKWVAAILENATVKLGQSELLKEE